MDKLQAIFDSFVQTCLGFLAAHPEWALVVIFMIAMGEALLVIGLFVPSTAVLIGAGTLVGAGKLPFWPVIIATIVGCIVGDQLSYWAGRIYGDRLKAMWPLRNYPTLLEKGEDYVRKRGGMAIAIGRFIPGVKAVIPGIAGMFGMGQGYFLFINLVSGTAWGLMHVLPGVILGQALSLAGELSGRLLEILVVLLLLLAVAGWLVRLAIGGLQPLVRVAQARLSALFLKSTSPSVQRIGRVVSPRNPSSKLFILAIFTAILAIIVLADLVTGLLLRNAVSDFDHSIFNFFSELRSVPGDGLFVPVTMFGDQFVLYLVAAIPIGWLVLRRNWRAAAAFVLAMVAARLIILGFSFGIAAPGSRSSPIDFKFPSHHVLLAGTVYGALAATVSRGLQRWSQAIVVACAVMLVIAIGFSRLYLGVNWLSDVIGGGLIAIIICALYSISIATVDFKKSQPLVLISASVAMLLGAVMADVNINFESRFDRYQAANKMAVFTQADYLATGWKQLPEKRINLVGRRSSPFVMQWIGPIEKLDDVLAEANMHVWPRWGWRSAIDYLDPQAPLENMAPNPAIHEGLRAKSTATLSKPDDPTRRIVLRAYQSNSIVSSDAEAKRVFLIDVSVEHAKRGLGLYAVPMDTAANGEEIKQLLERLTTNAKVEVVATPQDGGKSIVIMTPKS